MSADRTPLQAAAKRVYEALEQARALCLDMQVAARGSSQLCRAQRVETLIDGCNASLEWLMHEEDRT